jgi:predicted N-acetyltransferase YhbS
LEFRDSFKPAPVETEFHRLCDARALSARAMSDAATLIPLDNVDPALVEALLDRAFEPERRTRTAYKVREGTDWLPALSFAAIDGDEHLVGTIQCWPVALTDPAGRKHPLIMVGPVAVLPEAQGQGFGQVLMSASLAALNPQAPLPQVMIGDPEYYGRFWGFSNALTGGWQLPGPFDQRRLLVRCDNPAVLPEAGALGPWRG